MNRWRPALREELGRLHRHVSRLPAEAVYLVPLRAFLGLGWLRASVEKLSDPGWQDGTALRLFIEEQAAGGLVLPFYAPVLDGIGLLATPVGVAVMGTELAIGIGILCGIRTVPALLAAIFLNVNFVMAGETNPSVFYILIALVLLAGGAGALLGWEGLRPRAGPIGARSTRARRRRLARHGIPAAAGTSLLLLPFITTTSPALVIYDPAAVLALLLVLVAFSLALRQAQGSPPAAADVLRPSPRGEIRATRQRVP